MKNKSLVIILTSFFLFDYYFRFLGGRIFDYVGLLMLLNILLFGKEKIFIKHSRITLFYIVNAPFWIVFSILGIIRGSELTSLAFLVGAFFVLPAFITLTNKHNTAISEISRFLILINLFFFILQYLLFKVSGYVLNLHPFEGQVANRIFNVDIGYFRAAGLFQEVNTYSVALFFLITIRYYFLKADRDYLFWISIITLVLGESLWGLLCAIIMLVLFVEKRKTQVIIVASIFLFIIFLILNQDYLEYVFSTTTIMRFFNLTTDASVVGRMGLETTSSIWGINHFFGAGISVKYMAVFLGSNGYSFYIFSFGIFGTLVFVFSIVILYKRQSVEMLGILFILFLTYPYFSYMIFWAWMGVSLATKSEIGMGRNNYV